MKKLISIILSSFKYIVILWVPILLIEESFLLNYIGVRGSFICSILLSIICLIIYITTYDENVKKLNINCYVYNIINTIVLVITNLALGYLFLSFIQSEWFHPCNGSYGSCFFDGVEYWLIASEYAFIAVILLISWLFLRLIKYFRK